MLDQYIEIAISVDYRDIIADFNAVDRFLHKCFSVSLTLKQNHDITSVTYS
jgi:hypothetical protein